MHEELEETVPEEPPVEVLQEPEPEVLPEGTQPARLPEPIVHSSGPENSGHYELMSCFSLILTDSET